MMACSPFIYRHIASSSRTKSRTVVARNSFEMKRRSRERERQVLDYSSVSFEREEGKKKLEIGNSKHASNNGQDFKSLNPMSSFFSSGWKAKYAASSAITKYKDWKNRKI